MKTVTGLYDTYEEARAAVKALEDSGISANDISIVSNMGDGLEIEGQGTDAAEGAGTGATVGAMAGGAGGLLTGLGMLAIPGVGPVVAAGWLAATLAGAVTGAVIGGATGGIIGAMVESGIPEEDAQVYAEGVRRGGSLVITRTNDDNYPSARAILVRTRAVDLPERKASYVGEGWRHFDADAAPYVRKERTVERVVIHRAA